MVDVSRAEQIAIITSVAAVAGLPDSSVRLRGVLSRSDSVVLRLRLVVSTRWAATVVSLLRAPTFVSSAEIQLRRNKPRIAAALGGRPFELIKVRTVALGPDGHPRPTNTDVKLEHGRFHSTVTRSGDKQSPRQTQTQGDVRKPTGVRRQDEDETNHFTASWNSSQWLSAGCVVLGVYIIAQLHRQRQHHMLSSSPYRFVHMRRAGADDSRAYGSFFLQPTSRYLPHPDAGAAGAIMGQSDPGGGGMFSLPPHQQHDGVGLGPGLAAGFRGRSKPEAEIELLQQHQVAGGFTSPSHQRDRTRDSRQSHGRDRAGARNPRPPQSKLYRSRYRGENTNDRRASDEQVPTTAAEIEPQNEL